METIIAFVCSVCLLFIVSCSDSDKKECKELRNGEFYYLSKISLTGSTIIRNDSIQIVTNNATGEEQKERINWIGPCTYLLNPISETNSTKSDLFPVKIDILEIREKYYRIHVSSERFIKGFNDTIWIRKLIGGFTSIGKVFSSD